MMNKFKLYTIVLVILSIVFLICECKSLTNGDTAEWQTVFFDDFNRSDGPIGSNYSTIIGSVLASSPYTFSISNNKLKISSGGVIYYAIMYVNDVTNDVIRVSVKFSTTGTPSDKYIFGISAKSMFLSNEMQEAYSGFVWMDTDSISIYKFSGISPGLPIPLISKAYDVQENKSYLLELTINNEDLTFIVKDLITEIAETLNFEDTGSLLTGSIVCINVGQDEGDVIYFDDFKIEKYE